MEEENSASGLYRPHMGAQTQSVELPRIDQCEPIHGMDDSQLVGVPVVVAGDSALGRVDAASKVDVEVKAEVNLSEGVGGKRKRGRPPRGQANPPPAKKNKEEEDVCFICFDGGSLVLCDRRSCPKAYHPACIKRDEAFFQSRARWDCGWHICSICQKAAHYMCYTCTYSLCKRCTKDADYLCVRGDKGFCTNCMRTVMLLENNEQGNKEMPQVDFDDKSSWEYLFKVYWIYLKEKLSLTLTDLTQAKNPWNGIDTMGFKGKLPGVHFGTNDGKDSRSSGNQEADTSKRRKTKEQLMILNKDPLSMEKPGSDKNTSLIGCTEWATKELLEFVAHVKNGDTSVLSQFNVQTLLLDYIKRNNLRDPRRKSQIRCDLRLKALFGKPRVGHSEMLKLLEFHFLVKEEPRNDVFIQAGVVDAVASEVEADEYNDNILMMDKDKKCKTRRKGEDRALQTNLDQYAAIDVHNINLIYLRLNLMENLIEDNEKFHDNVVGSIVRLRISISDQKQDMYRLVQVVGTTKVDVPYKIGNRTASVMLEVLNLDKKESISIDAISNQDFSEEECRRLRQSIRRGLVKRWTVGEIQKKAMALQAVKLKDWLETEILRLSHLRDRASEKGRKKDLRECVEKLQLLKTPEECERRLREIPEVHSDPNYESEGDAGESNDKNQGEYVKTRYSGSSRKGSKSISQRKTDKEESDTKALERVNEGKDACVSFAGIASETSTTPLSTESTPSANNSGTIKLWHYRDPSGKIQGPFSMVQLQKWNTTGIFPPDMRIWVGDIQDKSLLLTDALNGRFHKTSPLLHNVSLQSQEVGGASDSKLCNPDVEWSESMHAPGREDSKQTEGLYTARAHSAVSNELTRSNGWDPHSSDWTAPIISYCKEIQAGSGSQHVDSFMGNSSSYDKTQVHSPLLSHHGKGHEAERWNSDPNNGIWNSHETTLFQITGGQSHESQSSGQNLRPLPVNFSSINLDSNSCIVSVTKSTDSFEQNGKATENKQHMSSNVPVQDSHIPILPSASPKTSNEDQKGQASENKQPVVPSNFPVQDSGPSWSSASRLVVDVGQLREPIEFSTLAEESVSDLLAEVDAMESQGGLASPTSVMNCGEDDLINGPKDDCFSSIDEEFSPTPDPGKSDALSSTSDIRLPHLSTITDELFGASPADVVGQSSTSGEVDGETKSTDVPVNQGEAGSHIQSSSPLQQSSIRAEVEEGETKSTDVLGDLEGSYILFTMKQDIVDASIARRAGLEAMDTGWGTMQESSLGNGVEEGEATKSADVPVNHGEAGSDSTQPAARFITSQNLVDSDVARGARSEDMVTGWRTMQQSSAKAKAEGKSKSTHVSSNNQKGSEAMDTGSRPIQQSSTRVEVEEGEIKSSDVPVSQYMIDTNIARRAESEAMDSGWGTMHGNVNLGSGRLSQGNSDMGWATSQGIIARGNANTNHGSSAGSVGRESQRRHGGERYTSPRDRAFPGGSSGFSPRGKPSWSRQSYGGSGGGGGGYSRHSPKGQRVCKFHESGHCKKGALCNYLHP